MTVNPTTLNNAVTRIHAAGRIALATHVGPDADAVGSTLGMALALQTLGKEVAVLCDDAVPQEMHFLPGVSLFSSALPEGFIPDLLIGLDASDPERLGKVAEPLLASGMPVIVIDHHITNTEFGSENVVDPATAATAELLVTVLDALDAPLTEPVAECLMLGLIGDTRRFTTASVTPATLTAAARLQQAGAEIGPLAEALFERLTADRLRLQGEALSHLRLEEGVIWSVLTQEMRKAKGLMRAEAKGLSSLLLTAEEAQISATFNERNGGVECSFRARPGYDVAQIALALGGGGHPLAAGCTIPGPPEDAAARVVALLKQEVARRQEG